MIALAIDCQDRRQLRPSVAELTSCLRGAALNAHGTSQGRVDSPTLSVRAAVVAAVYAIQLEELRAPRVFTKLGRCCGTGGGSAMKGRQAPRFTYQRKEARRKESIEMLNRRKRERGDRKLPPVWRAVIYLREPYPGERNSHGSVPSVDQQRVLCRLEAREARVEVVGEFVDWSGSSTPWQGLTAQAVRRVVCVMEKGVTCVSCGRRKCGCDRWRGENVLDKRENFGQYS